MEVNISRIVFFVIILLFPSFALAQVLFSEGVMEYNIQIKSVKDSVDKQGTYLIQLKDGNVRKELKLNDGYSNVSVTNFNSNRHIFLQKINHQPYAVEMTEKEYRKQTTKYQGATYKKEGTWLTENVERPQQLTGQKWMIKYKDGKDFIVYASEKYTLQYPEIFERSPQLKGIPVFFQITMENGYTMSFRLEKCVPDPVSNAVFRIPEGYRIISKQEYDKLAK